MQGSLEHPTRSYGHLARSLHDIDGLNASTAFVSALIELVYTRNGHDPFHGIIPASSTVPCACKLTRPHPMQKHPQSLKLVHQAFLEFQACRRVCINAHSCQIVAANDCTNQDN